MGKNKLRKFAEMETFPNVFQFTCRTMGDDAWGTAPWGTTRLASSYQTTHSVGTTRPASSDTQQAQSPTPHPMAGHWRDTFFHNDHPIVLELGCGRGDYTVGLAAAHPERNYIGIDIKGARMWAGARQAVQQGMTNVAFLRTNIEIINLFFAPSEVDEIWITFPDPQMKKATKRLTSTWFMARYARLLRPGGRIHLKTDSPFLYTYTRAMIETNHLPLLADTDDLYNAQCTMRNAQWADDEQCGNNAQCAMHNAQWGEALGDDAMLGDDAARVVKHTDMTTRDASSPQQALSEAHCALRIENCALTEALSEATLLQTHYERQWLSRGMTIKYLCWQLDNAQCTMRNAQCGEALGDDALGDDAMLGDDAARVVKGTTGEVKGISSAITDMTTRAASSPGTASSEEHCALRIENCALSEALSEPDIEIEHDTYRSYGRNYN